MINKELQEYLKRFPDDAIVTAVVPTVTQFDIGTGNFMCGEEGISPLTIENIEYNDCENYILIFQEDDW